jgi:hypothetical protein
MTARHRLAGGSFLRFCSGWRLPPPELLPELSQRSVVCTARETAMNRWIFAVGLLVTGLAVSTAAGADYALVQFGDGYCRIWWDSAGTPWGNDWTKVALGLPDHEAADAALSSAIAQGVCR